MRIVVLNKYSCVDFVDPVVRRLTVHEMCVFVFVYVCDTPFTYPTHRSAALDHAFILRLIADMALRRTF